MCTPTKSAAAGAALRPVSAVGALIVGSSVSLAFEVCRFTKHELPKPAGAAPHGGSADNWL